MEEKRIPATPLQEEEPQKTVEELAEKVLAQLFEPDDLSSTGVGDCGRNTEHLKHQRFWEKTCLYSRDLAG